MEEYEMTCSECGRRFRVQVTTMNVPGGKEREESERDQSRRGCKE